MALTPRNGSNLHRTPQEQTASEQWWEGGSSTGSIEEESSGSEYYLDLGAESPSASTPNLLENKAFVEQWAAAGAAVPRALPRRPSWRSASSSTSSRLKKDAVDRDCGICFEYAVVPCRTLCCGKIFCTEHLADWLHGPNAEGRCPNCENACSLEGGTLSLAPPTLLPSSQAPKKRNPSKPALFPSSPLAAIQPHHNDTLLDSPSPAKSTYATSTAADDKPSVASSSTSSSATTSSSCAMTFSDEERLGQPHGIVVPAVHSASSVLNLGDSTTPFSSSWGTASRFMSIVTFLMFLYKLLS